VLASTILSSTVSAKDYYVMCGAQGKDGYVMSATFEYDRTKMEDQKKQFKEYVVGNYPKWLLTALRVRRLPPSAFKQDGQSLNDANAKIKERVLAEAKENETLYANHVIFTD
jgi:hypothetical protein